jgi:hypothetical protein
VKHANIPAIIGINIHAAHRGDLLYINDHDARSRVVIKYNSCVYCEPDFSANDHDCPNIKNNITALPAFLREPLTI